MPSPGPQNRLVRMAFIAAASFFSAGPACLGGVEPSFEISASSTNLIVTEQLTVTLSLVLQGLGGQLEQQPPFVNQRAPHVEAPFLAQDWSPGPIAPVNPKQPFPGASRTARRTPSFTLNNYVSSDIFSSMSDPFGMMDDDFFGPSMLGPKRMLFPFTTSHDTSNGANAWHFTVSTSPYRAVSAGTVTLPPVRIVIPLIDSVQTRRDHFGRAITVPVLKEISLATKPLAITVSAPPVSGRPPSYCGAICSNFSAKATLDTNICTAGDPLVLTLDVSGPEDLSAVHPPAMAQLVTNGIFRIDDASVKTDTLAGTRRFTWRVRAVKAGTVEFPAFPVSFYDLKTRGYATVMTESMPIQVKAGAQAMLGALETIDGESDALPMPDGIDLDRCGMEERPFLPHLPIAVALFLLPPVLFLLVRIAPPVRRHMAARNAAYRRATAFSRCRKALKSRDPAKRRRAICTFFDVRYGVNGATVTAADAERLMAPDFTAEETAIVVSALMEMDRTEYSARRTLASFAILFASVLCGTAAFAAEPASSLEFTYRRAGILATRASGESGFRAAAEAYGNCLAAGSVNPVLLVNLGTCRLLAGDTAGAQAAYSRAERWGGETPSTRRGLLAARARRLQDPRAELPLARMFLRPHFMYSADARLVFAASSWALLWLLMLLPPGGAKRFLVACCAILFAAAAVSVSISVSDEWLVKGGVHEKA